MEHKSTRTSLARAMAYDARQDIHGGGKDEYNNYLFAQQWAKHFVVHLEPAPEVRICTECGVYFVPNLDSDAYIDHNCFNCSFWLEKIDMDPVDKREQTIINGVHMMACPSTDGPFQGMGGRQHIFEYFDDGRMVFCDNVWYQGEIPERFRDRLPDNARVVSAE